MTFILSLVLVLAAALPGIDFAPLVGRGQGPPASRAPVLEPGKPFPPLVLPRLSDGKPGSIIQYRGRKVIVHVFASW